MALVPPTTQSGKPKLSPRSQLQREQLLDEARELLASDARENGGGSDVDDIPFDENSQGSEGYFEEGEEEEDGQFSQDLPEEGVQEKDRLLHWWCSRQLNRCLRKLTREGDAGPFLDPVPWQALELDDYLEIVTTPMDLRTISERLDANEYEDSDGLINPELFWADTALCWDNCLKYYEDDEELDACIMARSMTEIAERLEDEFWVELESFEQNIEEVDPTLGGVAAAMDVAAGMVEEMAGVGYDSVANWFKSIADADQPKAAGNGAKKEKKLDFGRDSIINFEVDYDPDEPASPLDYQFFRSPPAPLRDQFCEILQSRYRYAAQKELEDIELRINTSINAASKMLDERDEEADFDGLRQKIPLGRLFPGLAKVSRAKQKAAPKGAPRRRPSANSAGTAQSKSKGRRRRHADKQGDVVSDATSSVSGTSSRGGASSQGGRRWKRTEQAGTRRDRSSSNTSRSEGRSSITSAASGQPNKLSGRAGAGARSPGLSTLSGVVSEISRTNSLKSTTSTPASLSRLRGDSRMTKFLEDNSEDEKEQGMAPTPSMNMGKLRGLLQKRRKPTA